MGKKNSRVGIFLIFAAIILQTTVLNDLSFKGAKADIALILIILIANYSGSIFGQLIGFSAGLAEDLLSLSPLGFNALIKSLIGFLAGITEGKMFLDPIVTPIVLVLIGTVIKYLLSFFLLLLFYPEKSDAVFKLSFLIETGMNVVVTPFIYLILKKLRVLPAQNNSGIL